jgi:hypothetical protein
MYTQSKWSRPTTKRAADGDSPAPIEIFFLRRSRFFRFSAILIFSIDGSTEEQSKEHRNGNEQAFSSRNHFFSRFAKTVEEENKSIPNEQE